MTLKYSDLCVFPPPHLRPPYDAPDAECPDELTRQWRDHGYLVLPDCDAAELAAVLRDLFGEPMATCPDRKNNWADGPVYHRCIVSRASGDDCVLKYIPGLHRQGYYSIARVKAVAQSRGVSEAEVLVPVIDDDLSAIQSDVTVPDGGVIIQHAALNGVLKGGFAGHTRYCGVHRRPDLPSAVCGADGSWRFPSPEDGR